MCDHGIYFFFFFVPPLNIIAKFCDICGGPWNTCGHNSGEMRSSRVRFINHRYLLPQLHISGMCVHFNTLTEAFNESKKVMQGIKEDQNAKARV